MTLYVLGPDFARPRPATLEQWLDWWLWSTEPGIVARTVWPDGRWVSTTFQGIELGFKLGAPFLWETMVFGGPLDCVNMRYTNRADAELGHHIMVLRVEAEDQLVEVEGG